MNLWSFLLKIDQLRASPAPSPDARAIHESAIAPAARNRSYKSARSACIGGCDTTERAARIPAVPTSTAPPTMPTSPNARVGRVLQVEDLLREHVADRGRRCREQPGERPQHDEFGGYALEHDAAARAQRAQHGAFVTAFVARGLHGGKQHHEPCSQREQEHVLHSEARLVHHVAHLREQRFNVDDGDFGELPHEVDQRRPLPRPDVHAGDERAGRAFEHAAARTRRRNSA